MSILNGFEERKLSLNKKREAIQKDIEEHKEEVCQLMELMENALLTPSEDCISDNEHDFEFFAHGNGKNESSYYFKCKQCNEVIVKAIERS